MGKLLTETVLGINNEIKTSVDTPDVRAAVRVDTFTKRVPAAWETEQALATKARADAGERLYWHERSVMETTLSLAINPLIRAVTIRQSPSPTGLNIGARMPAMAASIESCASATILKLKLKLCRNHTTIVAMRITENALCRKSLDLSQIRCPTFLADGSL